MPIGANPIGAATGGEDKWRVSEWGGDGVGERPL